VIGVDTICWLITYSESVEKQQSIG